MLQSSTAVVYCALCMGRLRKHKTQCLMSPLCSWWLCQAHCEGQIGTAYLRYAGPSVKWSGVIKHRNGGIPGDYGRIPSLIFYSFACLNL